MAIGLRLGCGAGLLLLAGCAAQTPVTRIADLQVGKVAVVRGRTGYIVEAEERAGRRTYTLRDDYNQEIRVRLPAGRPYPRLGITHEVRGLAGEFPATQRLYLEELEHREVYSQVWLYGVVAALVLLGVITIRRLRKLIDRRIPVGAGWGELVLVSGARESFSLHQPTVFIGREPAVEPQGIRLPDAPRDVSREHGVFKRQGERVTYVSNGQYGSTLDGKALEPGKPVPLKHGAMLRLGKSTVLEVRLQPDGKRGEEAGEHTRMVEDHEEDVTT